MTYPNAYAGIKKLFTSNILQIIGVTLLIITALTGIASYAAISAPDAEDVAAGFGVAAVITAIPGTIITIIAQILQLIGLNAASKDGRNFRIAFFAAIAALILAVVSGFFGSNETVLNFISKAQDVAQIISFAYSVEGIKELAGKINRPDLTSLAHKVEYAYVAGIVGSWILDIFIDTEVAGIGGIAILALLLIIYILYLVLLSHAKKALATA